GPGAATTRANGPPFWIDLYLLHARQIQYDAAVAGTKSGSAVATTTDSQQDALLASEIDDTHDIVDSRRSHDEGRVLVDIPVPHLPGLVVGGVDRSDDFAPQLSLQLLRSFFVDQGVRRSLVVLGRHRPNPFSLLSIDQTASFAGFARFDSVPPGHRR